ncbi:MAG: hypothetical protein J6S67_02235 [Methanobrevibacter sp.]|nr:hypothetical protein [Methanobrevibacter sp.]
MSNEIALFENTNRPFYCSVKTDSIEEKKKLFNALENCDLLLNNCVGERIIMKDIYVEQYIDKKDENDDGKVKYRTIIFAEDGKTYVSTSYGIYNILNKIFAIYGTPDKWSEGIAVEVAKRPVGNGKEMLTLKLV